MERTGRQLERDLEAWRISKGVQVKMEAQTMSTSRTFQSSGPVCTKTEAHVAYMHGLGHSLYGWKGISLLGEVNHASTRLITRGDVVLRLRGSRACSFRSQIDLYRNSTQLSVYQNLSKDQEP
uniref:Uncharacterized protein n=1 Tax=Oryza sativa subsp. japonica TaxID=39947 RepID=Q2QPR4_ORYSJ|nr:hypothetical protein LOC_Os12g33570 [Oryza sativa Japonica Group]